jgi:hypothetical protein
LHPPNPGLFLCVSLNPQILGPRIASAGCCLRLNKLTRFDVFASKQGWYRKGLRDAIGRRRAVEKRSSPARFATDRRSKLAPITLALGFVYFSLLAGFLTGAAARAALPDGSSPASRPGLPFAIADFDGDSRPDLARVEAGPSDFANTEYWIQLRLSAAGSESIRLVAPVGGLQLVARDVNGDDFVDLVVSTVWSNRPVAIYLNDGHGSFTHAEPAAFPNAFSDAATIWTSGGNLATESVAVASAAPAGICAGGRDLRCERGPAALSLLSRPGFPNSPLLFLRAGRAPPFDISHF